MVSKVEKTRFMKKVYNYVLISSTKWFIIWKNPNKGKRVMTRSELIKIVCQKNNMSLSELARQIGQTPQNFSKKLLRNTVTDEELSEILTLLNVVYQQKIIFADNTMLEVELND